MDEAIHLYGGLGPKNFCVQHFFNELVSKIWNNNSDLKVGEVAKYFILSNTELFSLFCEFNKEYFLEWFFIARQQKVYM